jgi:hypothetical protein
MFVLPEDISIPISEDFDAQNVACRECPMNPEAGHLSHSGMKVY